ncbi:hypothetical protein NO2_1059 [Candidatus Termititenax persephonae]|uniref:Cell division protein FtsL n=1 Tax=Candidatus Termititenax persephonae TaxID=2218525 RepID=A0A388THB6_9BACT|nr:hypothetical protein NO2_1059 [Candidatus Termititenax persephonae]
MTAKDWGRILLAGGLIFFALSALALFHRIPQRRLTTRIAALEKQIQALQYENEKLQIALARQTGLEYLDAQAARLGLIRPTRIRFIQKSKTRSTP